MGLLDDSRLDRSFLDAHGFDAPRFEAEAEAVANGRMRPQDSVLTGAIEPAPGVVAVDPSDEDARARGEAALRDGRVAVVVLNGGMATRFGGVVKGVVEVSEGRSFLALKIEDVRRARERFGRPLPFVTMNSFATAEATEAHLKEHDRFGLSEHEVLTFEQTIAVRLTPDGELFTDGRGQVSYYAPGHGDFFPCIRSSGVLKALRERGVQHILFSNVDNLGATIDPVVLGHHLRLGTTMTVEVTEKRKNAQGQWDKGGAPALVDGAPMIIEGFRFPSDFAQEVLPDFSTNTMYFSTEALEQAFTLPRHVVTKSVDDRTAIQLEAIACEAAAAEQRDGRRRFSLGLLRVERDGPRGRFFPVKEPNDLDAQREALVERLESGWADRDGRSEG